MKLPHPRPTLRGLMLAVALVACSLAAWREYAELAGLRWDYRMRALTHATLEEVHSGRQVRLGPWVPPHPGKIAYHAAMRAKYERASRMPWLPVEPDPHEPK